MERTRQNQKIGRVLLGRFGDCDKYEVRYLDRKTKRYVRRRLSYTKFSQAKAFAEALNVKLIQNGGSIEETEQSTENERQGKRSESHTVAQAALEAIRSSDANDITRVQYARHVNTFASYLEEHQPSVRFWADLNERTIQEYHEHCRDLALSWDSIRQRIAVLRLTSRHMARTYPGQHRDVTAGLKIKRRGPSKSDQDLANAILKPDQLRSFLGWIANYDPMLAVFAHMAGLTGMRGRECHYLREQDVDFALKTITITENEAHTPKTRASYRTIPVCDAVLDSLKTWIDGHWQKRPGDDFLFPAPKNAIGGKSAKYRHAIAGCFATETISKRFRTAIDAAKADGISLPPKFVARKLRATFVTAMRGMGADYCDLQEYVGQTVGTVMSDRYDHASMERLGKIAERAQLLVE